MQESSDPHISYSIQDRIFIMQIQRPEKKNALLPGMYRALAEGLQLADHDPSINVILIRGVDDCFTSGNDVSGFAGSSDSDGERPSHKLMLALIHTGKPIVAAVSGLAIGIGTTLLLHCDLVYASQDCYLQMPFTRLGLCPEAGSSYLLPRLVGYQRAAELLLLGDRFSSATAREYGIVTRVLPQDEYLEYALARCHELASLPPAAVRKSKELMKRGLETVLPDTIDLELTEFGELLKTPETQAIVQAFLTRKKTG